MRRPAPPTDRRPLGATLLAAALLLAAPAGAVDIVVNGDFDQDTAGWAEDPGDVQAVWDALDVDASGASGSAAVTSTDAQLDTPLGISQCLELPFEEPFDFSGSIYVPSGQSEIATVGYSLDWDGGEACDVGSILVEDLGDASATDTWETVSVGVEPPEGARGVVVTARIAFAAKNQPAGAFTAHFDAITLVPEPGARAAFAALTLALAGCGATRRRPRRRG